MLYSELELLSEAHPELMQMFNLALAKGGLEERMADTGLSLDDLDPASLHEQVTDLLALQASAQWKSRHAELQHLREGLYADLYAEKEAAAVASAAAGGGRAARAIKGFFSKGKAAGEALKGSVGRRVSSAGRRGSNIG